MSARIERFRAGSRETWREMWQPWRDARASVREAASTGALGSARSAWGRVPRLGRVLLLGIILLALAAAYPYYRDSLFEIPVLGPFPTLTVAVTMLIYATMALGLNVVVGYAGLLDLGYVAFYGVGAYTVALLASPQLGNYVDFKLGAIGLGQDVPGIHVNVWLLFIIAALVTTLFGVMIGLPTLRLRGDYLAIVTLGFGEIISQVFRNGDNFFGANVTGGPAGAKPIDPPGFGSWIGQHTPLPATLNTEPIAVREKYFYWIALAILLIALVGCSLIRESRLGRAWVAIREDETAASAMGIPLMRTKTWAYAIGAFFGGLAGGYYASFKGSAFPDEFFFNISVIILAMVILGGMGRIAGVIVGALFLAFLNSAGLANIGAWMNENIGTDVDVPKYQFLIFGVILVATMLFRPQGLIPEARRKVELEADRSPTGPPGSDGTRGEGP